MAYAVTILLIVGLGCTCFAFAYEASLRNRYPGPRDATAAEATAMYIALVSGLALLALDFLLVLGWGLWAVFT